MTKRTLLTVAAFGALIAAGGCSKKDGAATDTASAAMGDTMGMSGSPTGTMGTSDTAASAMPTMSDTAMRDTSVRSSGDTTTKK